MKQIEILESFEAILHEMATYWCNLDAVHNIKMFQRDKQTEKDSLPILVQKFCRHMLLSMGTE